MERAKNQQYFSINEITSILGNGLSALTYLEKKRFTHGLVNLDHILVLDQNLFKSCLSERILEHSADLKQNYLDLKNGKDLYLSPEIFTNLSKRNIKFKLNPFKSDLFSLGLVILQLGTLKSIQKIYDKQTGKIKMNVLLENMDEFNKIYNQSDLLREVLVYMLVFDPELRRSPREMYPLFQSLKSKFASTKQQAKSFNSIHLEENCHRMKYRKIETIEEDQTLKDSIRNFRKSLEIHESKVIKYPNKNLIKKFKKTITR